MRYAYDSTGNQTSVINGAGNQTRFEYDGIALLTREIDPAGRATRFIYDATDKRTRIDALNRRMDYAYDLFGRVLETKYQGRSEDNRIWNWDPVGRLKSVLELGKGIKANATPSGEQTRFLQRRPEQRVGGPQRRRCSEARKSSPPAGSRDRAEVADADPVSQTAAAFEALCERSNLNTASVLANHGVSLVCVNTEFKSHGTHRLLFQTDGGAEGFRPPSFIR